MDSEAEYMGDGVYVTFDGFGLEIRVNSHLNPMAVYLEPQVLKNINNHYQVKLKEKRDENAAIAKVRGE